MSLVPVQHLSWQLAQRAEIADENLYKLIRKVLIRSMAYCKMTADALSASFKEIRKHPRYEGDAALFCVVCEVRLRMLLWHYKSY